MSYRNATRSLHSEEISVLEIDTPTRPLVLATTNGRLNVWASRFYEIEPEYIAFLDGLESTDILWDIGCSIGHFSAYAAIVVGCTVIGFEPESQNYATAVLNQYLNQENISNNYNLHNIAIGCENKFDYIHCRLYGAGEHTKKISIVEASTFSQAIQVMSPERYLELQPNSIPTVIKIDVDGYEQEVFDGLRNVLALGTVRKVFMEISIQEEDEFINKFAQFGFNVMERHNVVRMSGGIYPDIVNVVFERTV